MLNGVPFAIGDGGMFIAHWGMGKGYGTHGCCVSLCGPYFIPSFPCLGESRLSASCGGFEDFR